MIMLKGVMLNVVTLSVIVFSVVARSAEHLLGLYSKGRLLTLPANIRLGWK